MFDRIYHIDNGDDNIVSDEELGSKGTPTNKLERLLTLYYWICMEPDNMGFCDEWSEPIFTRNFGVSTCTARRYIKELTKTDRVRVEVDGWDMFTIYHQKFSSLYEIDGYIKSKETMWEQDVKLTAENKRLIHLIRIFGWMDLFFQYGRISEQEITMFYPSKSDRRKVQRDFMLLRKISTDGLDIKRVRIEREEEHKKEWFYVIDKEMVDKKKEGDSI